MAQFAPPCSPVPLPPPQQLPRCVVYLCQVRDAHVALGLDYFPGVRLQLAQDDLELRRLTGTVHTFGAGEEVRTRSCVVLPAPFTPFGGKGRVLGGQEGDPGEWRQGGPGLGSPTRPTLSPFLTSHEQLMRTCWFLNVMAT